MMKHNLAQLKESGIIRELDIQLTQLLSEYETNDDVLLMVALTSAELGRGHVCLPLTRIPSLLEGSDITLDDTEAQWMAQCNASAIVGDAKPLQLTDDRLYLQRYWQYEESVAQRLIAMSEKRDVDEVWLKSMLGELFEPHTHEIDWQQVAVVVAMLHRFAVISGGPGTGKTTTVTKLLALLQAHSIEQGEPLRIALAAPTGKAAARLSESIATSKSHLTLASDLLDQIPSQASTLHRLLGVIPNSMKFRHNQYNPLHLDLLVVDEASMIDLPMMARLLDALPPHARLILLGDREQLASVEAGSVLADICSFTDAGYSEPFAQRLSALFGSMPHGATLSPIQDGLSLLHKSYRFKDDSGIGLLANQVRSHQRVRLDDYAAFDDINLMPLTHSTYQAAIALIAKRYSHYITLLTPQSDAEQMRAVLSAFNQTRMLCALREGRFGVTGLNQHIESQLESVGQLTADGFWYHGRPVMIKENQHGLGLYNGDIGMTQRGDDGLLKVWFIMADNSLQSFTPSRLPTCETAFAMTVHKSQGSEFTEPMLMLPPKWAPIISRELLYTGITRARAHLDVIADIAILNKAINSPTQRSSGLSQRLSNGLDATH